MNISIAKTGSDLEAPDTKSLGLAVLPDIKVKPPGSTTPADVFSTVPLVVEDCQEGVLVCTCMDTVEEDDEEEDDGVDCVVQGRLGTVNEGLITSCRRTHKTCLSSRSAFSMFARCCCKKSETNISLEYCLQALSPDVIFSWDILTIKFGNIRDRDIQIILFQSPGISGTLLTSVTEGSQPTCSGKIYLGDLGAALSLRHLVGEVSLLEACGTHPLVRGRIRARW